MSNLSLKGVHLLIAVSLLINCAPIVRAQGQTTGAVQGRVYEIGGNGPVAGAIITVKNQDTGLERTTVTGADGTYFIATLPPGFYTISANRDGYESDTESTTNNFPVRLSKTNIVQPPPIGLRKAGSGVPTARPRQTTSPALTGVDSQVEQLVNTANATRGGNFDRRQLMSLPLGGVRSFDELAFLMPGVAPPPQAVGRTVGPGIGRGVGTSGQFSVNGLRSRGNNFTVDGSDNNDEDIGVRRQGFTSLVPQAIESVQEVQIATLLPDPQFGRNMAAQVNAVSRSGSNRFHGTAYGFFTDKRLKARDFFDLDGGPAKFPLTRADGVPVIFENAPLAPANPVGGEDAFTRGQYGGVIGGPIVKQKTLFFVSFEHQDVNATKESNFAVPTVAERGLFGSGDVGLRTVSGAPVLPASITGNAIFSLYPFPNNPWGPYGPNTWTEVMPANSHGTILAFRFDHNLKAFGRDHTLTARWSFADDDTLLPVTGQAIFSSMRALVRAQNLSLFFNSAISGSKSNQVRFSYGRTRLRFEEVRDRFLRPSQLFPNEPFLLNAPFIINATTPGSPPTFFDLSREDPTLDTESVTGPLGQVIVSGYSPIGVDVFNFPQGRTNNTYQYADTLVWNHNKHRVTLGADIRRTQLNSFLDRNFRPLATFSGAADIADFIGGTRFTPQDFYVGSDFVSAGAPTGFVQTLALFPDSTIGLRYWQNDFFAADQIRLRPNLSLTIGARYELNTVPTEVNRRIESTFNSDAVKIFEAIEREVGGVSGLEQFLAGRTKIFKGDTNNIAPHVALAWDPFGTGKTAIRAGYGIYYDQILGSVISQSRNVFPSFLPIDLAGVDFDRARGQFGAKLSFVNPYIFAVPGTLNTFDSSTFGSFLDLIRGLKDFSHTGPSFVLPVADLTTPYAQHWGLTVERQFMRDYLLSVAYVGTRGSHLLRFATPNLGPNSIPVVDHIAAEVPIPDFPELKFPAFFGTILPPHVRPARKRPFPLLGSFTSIESDANSNYHGLQAQLNKRFSHGVQFTTAYTWSHAIDEVSDIFDLAGARTLPQNSFDRQSERANANFDVRHRFVYSAIWALPFFEQNKWLGGWEVSSIGTFQTGQPFTIIHCCDVNLDGNLTDRLNTPNVIKTVNKGPVRFDFVPAGRPFAAPGENGSVGRNVFRAPGIASVDAAVTKAFRFTETSKLELRTEVFNAFNRPHFGVPVNQVGFSWLGRSTDTRIPARTIQFLLKYTY